MKSFQQVILIHGVPRSGTSWLGQIFNSSPRTAFRFQPLFSYAFKGRLTEASGREEIQRFFNEVYASDDTFVNMRDPQLYRHYPQFDKTAEQPFLVMKHVRYHYLLPHLLRSCPDLKAVGIVRSPYAVISSWLRAPREFKPGWNPLEEWRRAARKNQGRREDYFGFEKWKEAARLFVGLRAEYPDRFYLLKYTDLNDHPFPTIERLFAWCGLPVEEPTRAFIRESRSREINDPNAVHRLKQDDRKWQKYLPAEIAAGIQQDLTGTDLEPFG